MRHHYYKKLAPLMSLYLVNFFFINAVNMYLARKMGYALYGDYSIALLILFSIAPFFARGTPMLMSQELPKLIHQSESKKQYVFLKWNLSTLLKSCVVIIVFIASSYILQHMLRNNTRCFFITDCKKYRQYIRDLLYSLPLIILVFWNTAFLNSIQHTFKSQFLSHKSAPYFIGLVCLISEEILLVPLKHNIILIAIFAGFFTILFIQYTTIFYIIRQKKFSLFKMTEVSIPHTTDTRYKKTAFMMMFNQANYLILGSVVIVMLEIIGKTEEVVGHYSASFYIASFMLCFTSASQAILLPWLSSLNDPKRCLKLQSLINLFQINGFVFFLINIVFFLVFKEMIYAGYALHYPHMTFTILAMITYNYVTLTLLSYPQKLCLFNNLTKELFLITFTEILVLIAGCYYFIPLYSILGAILSLYIAGFFSVFFCFYILKKNHKHIKPIIIM